MGQFKSLNVGDGLDGSLGCRVGAAHGHAGDRQYAAAPNHAGAASKNVLAQEHLQDLEMAEDIHLELAMPRLDAEVLDCAGGCVPGVEEDRVQPWMLRYQLAGSAFCIRRTGEVQQDRFDAMRSQHVC